MRLKLTIAYDGTDYLGWQSQKGGGAVQDTLEQALEKIFKKPIRIHGASRTDSGVHAKGQSAHIDVEWKHPLIKLKKALHSQLPATVRIVSLKKVSAGFHARFSAQGKRYKYKIKTAEVMPFESRYVWGYGYEVNIKKLNEALKIFEGEYDFTAFAGGVNTEENPIKKLTLLRATQKGSYIHITVEGSGFLYKMVRSIVGTAIRVGSGVLTKESLVGILKNKKRTHAVVTAPACGLVLDKVFYK